MEGDYERNRRQGETFFPWPLMRIGACDTWHISIYAALPRKVNCQLIMAGIFGWKKVPVLKVKRGGLV